MSAFKKSHSSSPTPSKELSRTALSFSNPSLPNTSWEGVLGMFLGPKYLLTRCLEAYGKSSHLALLTSFDIFWQDSSRLCNSVKTRELFTCCFEVFLKWYQSSFYKIPTSKIQMKTAFFSLKRYSDIPLPFDFAVFFFKVAQPSPSSTAFERCVWNTGTVQEWTHSANLLLRKVVLCIVGSLWSCSWQIGRGSGPRRSRAEDGSQRNHGEWEYNISAKERKNVGALHFSWPNFMAVI